MKTENLVVVLVRANGSVIAQATPGTGERSDSGRVRLLDALAPVLTDFQRAARKAVREARRRI